jgi:NTE family protein
LAFAKRQSALPAVKPLNLALQGGGAHGAFTWGVLDALLEDGRIRFDGLSGASAGTINAVLLAEGLMAGGPDAARATLAAFWRRLAGLGVHGNGFWPLGERVARLGGAALDMMTRIFSPYQFNPLDYNPLRRCLEETIDFERLRRDSPLRLFVAATEVASGRPRVFETAELTLEVVLASACLPHLHHAIKVGDRHYWDGGYSANPPVLPLVCGCRAEDSLIVQLLPANGGALPTATPEIQERVNAIVFNAPLRREMELIDRCRGLATGGWFLGNRRLSRLRRHRFHLIDASADTGGLAPGTRLAPGQELIEGLFRAGRVAAATWLKRSFGAVGQRSTIDLAAAFL